MRLINYPSARSQRGVALMAALIAAIIMGFIIATLLAKSNENVKTMAMIKQRVEAEIKADSLVQEIVFAHFKGNEIQKKGGNYFGSEFEYKKGVYVRLRDANALLSISSTPRRRWRALMASVGATSEQQSRFVDCLDDWQDRDDLKRLNGGERQYYQSRNLPGPRNGIPQTVSELQLVCGWPDDIDEQLEDSLIEMNAGGFNPFMASQYVLNTLSFTKEDTEYILRAREKDSVQQIAAKLGLSSTDFVDTALSDTMQIKLRVQEKDVAAHRNVVFNYNFRYDTAPILQFWRWSE